MNTDFESYRRERNIRRQKSRVTERPAGHSEVWEQLEEREASEMQDEILNAECDAFFTDATRLAASIVQRVSKNREAQISSKLLREMEEFLRESIRHATRMVKGIDWQRPHRREETYEPSLRNLVGSELDAFRAEGTAQLHDKHFGKDPFGRPDEERPPGMRKAQDQVARRPEPAAPPLPGSEEFDLREPVPGREPAAPAAPQPAAIQPVPAPSTPALPVRMESTESVTTEVEITERRIRLSDQELTVDFQSTRMSSSFQADEFDARVPDVAPIQQLPPAFESDELPLAATVTESGAPIVEVEVSEPVAASASPAPAVEDAPECTVENPAGSAAEAEKRAADDQIREALRLLVEQGIMSPEQARAAYRRQIAEGL